jgi:hypothetical protein
MMVGVTARCSDTYATENVWEVMKDFMVRKSVNVGPEEAT